MMKDTMNRTPIVRVAWLATVLLACGSGHARTSEYAVKEVGPFDAMGRARITVQIRELTAEDEGAAVRAIVTAADGSHVDGSGHGLYANGRFYADGGFEVAVPAGGTRIELSGGPPYVPLVIREDFAAGRAYLVTARLYRWFSPEARGWYCGDNHVHALHDARATVQASLAYTSLQARANGLNWITEAGSNVPYDDIDRLDSASFLLRYAPELRPGAYVGHVNTPGIRQPLDEDTLREIYNQPLPVQAVKKWVHRLGGVVAHTHPLSPPHPLHWMGATEFFSDAVMNDCADLFDVDSRATEWLWFMALNLGNRVGVSGSIDSALGRVRTLSPGDRRIYCHAKEFNYPAIVEALREGKTFATNGSAIFPFLQLNGHEPGDVIRLTDKRSCKAHFDAMDRPAQRRAEALLLEISNCTRFIELRRLGYGEEMPLDDIGLPFEGDHWWYPRNTYWQLRADFGRGPEQLGGGWEDAESYFCATSPN